MTHVRRVWRKSVGATLAEVAAIVGVSKVHVHRWEMGLRPSPVNDKRWLVALLKLESAASKLLESAKRVERDDEPM